MKEKHQTTQGDKRNGNIRCDFGGVIVFKRNHLYKNFLIAFQKITNLPLECQKEFCAGKNETHLPLLILGVKMGDIWIVTVKHQGRKALFGSDHPLGGLGPPGMIDIRIHISPKIIFPRT